MIKILETWYPGGTIQVLQYVNLKCVSIVDTWQSYCLIQNMY